MKSTSVLAVLAFCCVAFSQAEKTSYKCKYIFDCVLGCVYCLWIGWPTLSVASGKSDYKFIYRITLDLLTLLVIIKSRKYITITKTIKKTRSLYSLFTLVNTLNWHDKQHYGVFVLHELCNKWRLVLVVSILSSIMAREVCKSDA